MNAQINQSQNANWWRKLRHIVSWLALGITYIVLVANAYMAHSNGQSWASAFGLRWDRNILRPIGDFVIPVFAIMLMSRNIGKLPDSREKTVLVRICWWFFVFLLVWQLIRLFFLRPF